jgi:hypothetical protein
VSRDVLDLVAIGLKDTFLSKSHIVFSFIVSEAPLGGDNDLLSARELKLGSSKGFHDSGSIGVLGSDRKNGLSDSNSGRDTHGLSVSVTHTGLKSISSGATQHFVDSDHVEGVRSHSKVETFLSDLGNEVLVTGNSGSFEGFRSELFLLVRNEVGNKRPFIDTHVLVTNIVNSDLGIRYTSAVSRLDEGLVLLETVATGRSSSHSK